MSRLRIWAAALLALSPASLPAQRPSISAEDLRRHVEILASDEYLGRKPGTEGETKSIYYIASQWAAVGLQPVGDSWYQPVALAERRPHGHRATWSSSGRPMPFDQRSLVLIGAEPEMNLRDAPIVFAGHGVRLPDRGIDQLAGANLQGAVVLILYQGPTVDGFPSFAERVKAVAASGAAAVIGVVGDDIPWSRIVDTFSAGQNRLEAERVAPIQGAMPVEAAADLVRRAGGNLEALMNGVSGPEFRAVPLPLRVSLEVSTAVRRYTSHNVLGRIAGTGGTDERILYLGHWDHLGVCRPGAPDEICNGAVDNASGIAVLIEMARQLTAGPRPQRDILFLATTAEEIGLLGASAFAADPPVPLSLIVAAVNIDTIGLTGAGEPVAIIGRGTTAIDPLVEQSARELGRAIDPDTEANALIERQDGWVLTRAGVPTIMAQGAVSDMAKLGTFLSGDYHQPSDEVDAPIVLEGAAEDAELLVALARKLADPALYRPPAR